MSDGAKTMPERRRELLRRRLAERGITTRPSPGQADIRAGEPYRLSAGQRRMWFLQTLDPADTALNIGVGYRLIGRLDEDRLRRSLNQVVARHAILRTTYGVDSAGEPYQTFRDSAEIPWQRRDLRDVAENDRNRHVETLAGDEFGRPFRLTDELPLRVTLIHIGADEFVLLLVVHHICWDDGCWDVFFSELRDTYRGEQPAGEPPQYVAVQVLETPAEATETDLEYWRETLRPLPEPLQLPGSPRVTTSSRRAARRNRTLPAGWLSRVDALARDRAATPFMVLLAAFSALMSRYSGSSDLLVGVPVTERNSAAERAIGYFGNTLLLRITTAPHQTFGSLLDTVRRACLGGFAHAAVGVDQVVHHANPMRTPGRDGLDQLVRLGFSLRYQNTGPVLDGITAQDLQLGGVTAQLPLTLTVVLDPPAARIELEYQTDTMASALVDQMLTHYLQLLDSALCDPECRVSGLTLLGATERAAILTQSHGTLTGQPPTTMVALLESTAAATPEAVALISDEVQLSYAELHRRANRLARWLINAGVGTEDVIGLQMATSVEFTIAALAVLKAGAAYLPIDPTFPADRIDYLVADTGPRMVIGRADYEAAERAAHDLDGAAVTDADRIRPLHPGNLAYVIYTSGSTGRPKGVAVPHHAIAEHLIGFIAEWTMTAADRMLQSSSVSFDASLPDIFMTLTIGAALVVPKPGALTDIDYLTDLIDRQHVTVLHVVPALLSTLLLMPQTRQWRGLRYVPIGGEALPGRLADEFARHLDAELRNHYGPTEAVVCSTHKQVAGRQGAGVVPIGVPNRDVYAYVLDPQLQLLPAEITGELYLGGAQLARGYLGRSAMTAQRFVADPFNPGMRLYRTGDLVRRNRSGDLEFVGRADDQVKIRGFRIELGEVESAIAAHPQVRACLAVTEDDEHGPTLLAYLVPADRPDQLDLDEVRRYAASALPDYMLPSALATIPEIPLTASGKLDRAALPAPIPVAATRHREPVTPTERRICALFAGLFNRRTVGADDSFFSLGGHSLLAARLVAQVRAELGVELAVRAVFDNPTPAALANRLVQQFRAEFGIDLDTLDAEPEAAAADPDPARPPLGRCVPPQRIPLSYSQLAAWFQHRIEGPRDEFNLPFGLRLSGPLDVHLLTMALNDVVARHDALRTNFDEHQGVPYQVVHRTLQVELPVHTVTADRLAETMAELRRHVLTPESGPLIRAALLALDSTTHVLFLIVHHIVSDHASLGIIVDDLVTAYRARLTGQPPEWPELAIRFSDYALWQRDVFDAPGEWARSEVAYWLAALAGLPEQISVAADRPRPPVLGKRGEVAHFIVPALQRAALVRLGEQHGATEFMVYQAATALLLHKLGGGTDIAVGSPAAARVDPVTTNLVGLLANVIVLRNDVSDDPSPRTMVTRSRDTVLDAFAHQEAPIERLVEALRPTRSRSWNPLYQTMLHFHGADWASTPRDLSGAGETTAEPLPTQFDVALLDLDVGMTVTPGGQLAVRLVANADLYQPPTVARIAAAFQAALAAFATTPDRPASALQLLPAADSAELLASPATLAEPPRSASRGSEETERVLITLLEQLLDITGAAPDDNFFALGGDSIISIKWSAQATERGLTLTPAMVFEHLTIGELAAAVDAATANTTDRPHTAPDYTPMSASGLSADALAELSTAWSRQT